MGSPGLPAQRDDGAGRGGPRRFRFGSSRLDCRKTSRLTKSCYLGRFWPNEAKFHNVFNARVCARNLRQANF